MIDTDKYEGHTPAPWFYYDDGGLSDSIRLYHKPLMDSDGDDTEEYLAQIHYDENCITDARLIADAPLLLEEVKQLRRDRDLLWDAIRLSGTGAHQEEEIAFWHEKLLNMNEAELKEAFKGHYEDEDTSEVKKND